MAWRTTSKDGEAGNPGQASSGSGLLWIGGGLLVIVIYVLSRIPFALLILKAGVGMDSGVMIANHWIYAPLIWLSDHVKWVEKFYDWFGRMLGMS